MSKKRVITLIVIAVVAVAAIATATVFGLSKLAPKQPDAPAAPATLTPEQVLEKATATEKEAEALAGEEPKEAAKKYTEASELYDKAGKTNESVSAKANSDALKSMPESNEKPQSPPTVNPN